MIIPVGIFDDHTHVGINLAGRVQYKAFTSLCHESEAVFCPAHAAFGFNTKGAFAASKKEIVQDKIVKVTGCVFGNFLHFFAVFRVGITKSLETVGFIYGIGYTAADFQSFFPEKAVLRRSTPAISITTATTH